jgi:hypothetical protein
MKIICTIITVFLVALLTTATTAQTINWSALQRDQKHIINTHIGWDYAATFGVGYAYKFNTKIPFTLGAQVSVPAGENLTDDFKTKFGSQVRLFRYGNFQTSVTAYGIYRGYQSALVRLQNFGSEFTGIAGYYRPKWFVAAEFGFDKAITTHVKSRDLNKEYYPSFQDGWYIPTGGNFIYGIQTGYSMKSMDLYIKVGKTVDQNFRSTAMIPFYFQFGVNGKF